MGSALDDGVRYCRPTERAWPHYRWLRRLGSAARSSRAFNDSTNCLPG